MDAKFVVSRLREEHILTARMQQHAEDNIWFYIEKVRADVKVGNNEIHNSNSAQNIDSLYKSRRMKLAVCVEFTEMMRNAYKILAGNT
jgi:hypothetical protein